MKRDRGLCSSGFYLGVQLCSDMLGTKGLLVVRCSVVLVRRNVTVDQLQAVCGTDEVDGVAIPCKRQVSGAVASSKEPENRDLVKISPVAVQDTSRLRTANFCACVARDCRRQTWHVGLIAAESK